jgi:uncharacterized protein
MMTKAVLDSSVLVSAFLARTGVSRQLLHRAGEGAFVPCAAYEILTETGRVLLTYQRIRKRYTYTDDDVYAYLRLISTSFQMVVDLPSLRVVDRDPNDDMIVACAVKAGAQHIVTRDKDLLDLKRYQGIEIVAPETYLELLGTTSN